jgi:hypothetical protein
VFAQPARHVVVATGDAGEATLWHVVRNARGLWSKRAIDTLEDVRWPSAGAISFEAVERTVYVSGRYQRIALQVAVPWIFVAAGPRVIGYSMARDGVWRRVLSVELTQRPLHRVEAMTAWWGDADGGNRGVSLCVVSRTAWHSKTVSHYHIAGGFVYPLPGPQRPPAGDGLVQVHRTLGLAGADSNGGGDLLWHVELDDGTVDIWAYERGAHGTWTFRGGLCGPSGIGVPRIREGRLRMQRGPRWLDDNGYRQFAWLVQDDGQLGRLWYRHGAWHYQPLVVHRPGEADPEASRAARRRMPPVFLFDGRTVPWRHWQAPSGSLLFVSEADGLLWSAFSATPEDSLLHTRIDGDAVWLRCVTGASGLPIGWTYTPREDARPLLPGEHTGTSLGAWETIDARDGIGGCETRVRHACRVNPCACPDPAVVVPCGFRVLDALEQTLPLTPAVGVTAGPATATSGGHGPATRHAGSVLRHLGAAAQAALRRPQDPVTWNGETVRP